MAVTWSEALLQSKGHIIIGCLSSQECNQDQLQQALLLVLFYVLQ